eukprot:3316255-Prymnesium_polylepis.1
MVGLGRRRRALVQRSRFLSIWAYRRRRQRPTTKTATNQSPPIQKTRSTRPIRRLPLLLFPLLLPPPPSPPPPATPSQSMTP